MLCLPKVMQQSIWIKQEGDMLRLFSLSLLLAVSAMSGHLKCPEVRHYIATKTKLFKSQNSKFRMTGEFFIVTYTVGRPVIR